jgi:flagellar basal body-associated protein FliL
MKKEISPLMVTIAIVVVIVIVGVVMFMMGKNPAGSLAGQKPPGMPPSVAKVFQQHGASVTGPSSSTGAASQGAKTQAGQ